MNYRVIHCGWMEGWRGPSLLRRFSPIHRGLSHPIMRILSLPRSSHIQDIGMFCAYFLPYIQYLSQIVHNQPNCLWPKKRRNNYLYTFFFTYLKMLFRIMRQITPPPPDPCLPNVCPHVKIFTLYWIVCLVSGMVSSVYLSLS